LKCIKIYDERHVSLVRRKGLGYIAITDDEGQHVKSVTEVPSASINDEGHNVKSVTEVPYAITDEKGQNVKSVTEVPYAIINE
jgi:hypothetical protein